MKMPRALLPECLIMVFRAGTLSPCSGSSGEACSVAARHLCCVVATPRPRRSGQRRRPLTCVCQWEVHRQQTLRVCARPPFWGGALDVPSGIFISMPEERLAGACLLTITASQHSVDDGGKPPGRRHGHSSTRRKSAAGNLLLQQSRVTLRSRCKNCLWSSVHLFEGPPAATADATRSEFVDERHFCTMHPRETMPEPTLRCRGVAESC